MSKKEPRSVTKGVSISVSHSRTTGYAFSTIAADASEDASAKVGATIETIAARYGIHRAEGEIDQHLARRTIAPMRVALERQMTVAGTIQRDLHLLLSWVNRHE